MATTAQMRGTEFKLVGLDQVLKAFDQLPTLVMQKAIVRKAMKRALEPTALAARAGAPKGPRGNLQDSIRVTSALKKTQRQRGKTRSALYMYVGSTAPHAHLIEFGTKERAHKTPTVAPVGASASFGQTITEVKIVQDTGRVRPNPFLRNAWDASKGIAYRLYKQSMEASVKKAIKQLQRKKAKGTLTAQQRAGWSSFLDDFKGF